MPPLAKDLIGCQLRRNVEARLNILQVKEHRWLQEVRPIRETALQNFRGVEVPCRLKEYAGDKIEQPTATSINSDSDEGEGENQLKIIMRCRKEVKAKTCGRPAIFELKVSESEERLMEFLAQRSRLEQVEERVAEKRKEITRVTESSKDLLAKVFVANLELEQLHGEDSNDLAEKYRGLQKKLLDVSKECKVHKIQLESLRKTVGKESLNIANQEGTLKKLINNFKTTQELTKHANSDKRSSENELKTSISLLKQQLEERTSSFSTLSPQELAIAREISGTIRGNMGSFTSLSRDIQKKIEAADEKYNDIEQQMQEMKISYELKKYYISHNFRKAKNEFMQRQRKIKEDFFYLLRKKNENIKQDVRERLNISASTAFTNENTDILKAKSKILVSYTQILKNILIRLGKMENKKRIDHEKMKQAIKSF